MKIILQNVSKKYYAGSETITACKIDELVFSGGGMFAVTGPSASGKTTLLNIISGIIKPDSGSVKISGNDITKFNSRKTADFRLKNIGLIFQEDLLINELTVRENLEIIPQLSGIKIKIDLSSFTDLFQISQTLDKFPAHLSRGQRQRVSVLRSLLFDQHIIIADEPTANLDSFNAEIIYSFFRKLADTGKTIIVAAHDSRIFNFSDKIFEVKDGEIKERQ